MEYTDTDTELTKEQRLKLQALYEAENPEPQLPTKTLCESFSKKKSK